MPLPSLFDCREAARAQSELLDRSLSPGRYLWLQLHLLICRWCRRYGRQLRFLRHAAHRHADEMARRGAQKLPPEARDRIARALQDKS
jgi:hypothetical protein